ncbi:MAG: ABC transporter permease [Anaerolineae bacterium]|nr:MAG: ABC transporter permease [Anaerolineae bacterium]
MNAFWQVASYEYKRNVLRRGFLIALLSVPLWILVSIGIGLVMAHMENDTTPIGYVDHSGVLAAALPAPQEEDSPYDPVPLVPFADENQARAALDAKEIRGYYVLPEDYLQGGAVKVVYRQKIREAGERQFKAFVRVNLLAAYPPEVAQRALAGTEWETVMLDKSDVQALKDTLVKILVPFITGVVLYVGLFIVSGYLMRAVVDEKENRTMEILATSISPEQMMTGKVVGILGVGMTQVVAWLLMGGVAFLFVRHSVPTLPPLDVDWGLMGRILMVLTPAFLMVCGLMASIGATLSNASEGQQLTSLITLPLMLPFVLLGTLISAPNSPISVGLSLFPLTAPMTMVLRLSFGTVPAWQLVLSVVILWICGLGSFWLAGRVLRLGMLQYGRRLRLGEIWQDMLGSA